MESKSLLFGIIGFITGGLIVSIAASSSQPATHSHSETMSMSMSSMTDTLKDKTGKEFDQEFTKQMIEHYQGTIDIARLAADKAQNPELKTFSANIIDTQTKDIATLKSLQRN